MNNKGGSTNTPVYLIKPKYIFKSPFLKYDLQNPTNREAQNEQLTEYFNYGFNQDTMNIYAKLVNRTLKVLDHKKNLQYFDEPSELMRLNDQIPMDFGGFCKFYDPQVFKNDYIQNDQQLFKVFLFNTFKATYLKSQYPMLEFIKSIYPKNTQTIKQQQNEDQNNPLPLMIQQISNNIQKKYQETMKKLIQQTNQPKQVFPSAGFKKQNKFDKKSKVKIENKPIQEQKVKKQHKKQKQQSSSSSSSSSSSDSSSDSSDSSSQSESQQQKRKRKRKDRQSSKKDKNKKQRRSKQKQKRSKSSRYQSSRNKQSRKQSNNSDIKRQKYDNQQKEKDKKKDKNDRKERDSHRDRNRDSRNKDHDSRRDRDYRDRDSHKDRDRRSDKRYSGRSRSRDDKDYRRKHR